MGVGEIVGVAVGPWVEVGLAVGAAAEQPMHIAVRMDTATAIASARMAVEMVRCAGKSGFPLPCQAHVRLGML